MRPPSYYASIVKSNTGAHGSSGYSSSSSDSYSTPRTSSQQLRSSLSSTSSSNYVSRSHLPFVPQSTLVAHCFTGVGSSTRPYGSSSTPSSLSSSTSSYRRASRGTSPSYSASSLYTPSRPSSTNHPTGAYVSSPARSNYLSSTHTNHHYLSPSSSSSSSGANISSRSYPRSTATPITTMSSYYKPIRLRERPLLAQISRQLPSRVQNYNTPTSITRTTSHSNASDGSDVTKSEERIIDKDAQTQARLALPPSEGGSKKIKNASEQLNESNWSSDIGRNISRNKYLIKFREFDKHTRASVDVEATIQLPPVEVGLRDTSHDRDSCVPDRDSRSPSSESRVSLTVEHTIRLPKPAPVALASEDIKREEQLCDIKQKQLDAGVVEANVDVMKERKNVKLKLKPIGVTAGKGKKKKSELAAAEATATTTKVTNKTQIVAIEIDHATNSNPKKVKPETENVIESKEAKELAIEMEPAPETPVPDLADKKRVMTSIKKDCKFNEKTIAEENNIDNKENKQRVALKSETDIPTVPAAGRLTPPIATPKARRGSKATLATGQHASDVVQTEAAQKPKVKIIKKKTKTKKTKQEDESATPTKTPSATRRKSSTSIPKDAAPRAQVNEVQVKPATPLVVGANIPANITPSKQPSRIRFREYNINDFNFLTVLGHGGWGFVILAELKEHDACFAVKSIKKITIVEDDDYDSIMIERKVLTLGNIHSFICKLFCTFETQGYLFFVMEYCAGGDLMFHVQHEGKFTESRCRFYAAEIICAIRFLHNRHIIYRDLKLDNILLDAIGHIRLVDFGMCQCRTYREEMLPSNFCGTPEYISPEIIKGVPYNHSVDWWSFGVLLYEMAVGKMPFRGNDENELLWNVCYEQIHYPMFLSKELTSLLKLLLEREPTNRMGMATCKAGDIYDQPFFRTVDWKAVEELRVEPPFVPQVRSNRDVSNFDSDFTESTCELSPVDEATLVRIDQKQFEKFPYTNPDIFIFDPTQEENIAQRRSTAIL